MKELQAWKLTGNQINKLIESNHKKMERYDKGDVMSANKDSDFLIHKSTKDYYHCVFWVPGFDAHNGEPTNNPFIQCIEKNHFKKQQESLSKFLGHRVAIIHNPEIKEEKKEEPKNKSLEDLTRPQLMDLLDEKGIKYQKNENKDELISKLNA